MNLCPTCRKLVYRTDACKGSGVECGRTDGGSTKSTAARKDALEAGQTEWSQHKSVTAGTQAPPVDLTTRGTPRQRAPKGTFDRKTYQREAAKKRRDKQRLELLAKISIGVQPLVEAGNAVIQSRKPK